VDRDLVVAAQRGDQSAFVDLIRPRARRLLTMARQIVGNADLAEDALQDALVLAWRDLRGLRDPDRFDAWLHRIVVNLCIRRSTRDRRRTAVLRLLPVEGPAAPDDLQAVAVRDELERGFRRLSPAHRAALVLHHFMGYSHAEIAETLGIPQATARSRVYNAQLAMRAAIEADARLAPAGGSSR
jgi:RNA polymerase sigma-70 factor (ECF subfamily)